MTLHSEQLETEDWRDIRHERQAKRASNREASARLLREAGIAFEEKNGGAHLVVKHLSRVFDFWPGTGKWSERGTRIYSRGVRELIRAVS